MTSAGIRNAVIGDAEQISTLITELGYPTTAAAMTERLTAILSDANYVTFVADIGGIVIGVAGATLGRYYEKDGVYSWLVVLAVSSSARGLGIGTQLVQASSAGAPARALVKRSSTVESIAAMRTDFTNAADTRVPGFVLSNS